MKKSKYEHYENNIICLYKSHVKLVSHQFQLINYKKYFEGKKTSTYKISEILITFLKSSKQDMSLLSQYL